MMIKSTKNDIYHKNGLFFIECIYIVENYRVIIMNFDFFHIDAIVI